MIATKLLKEIIEELYNHFPDYKTLPFADKIKIAIEFQRNAIFMKAFVIEGLDLYDPDTVPGALERIAMHLGNSQQNYIETIADILEEIQDQFLENN